MPQKKRIKLSANDFSAEVDRAMACDTTQIAVRPKTLRRSQTWTLEAKVPSDYR